MRETPDFAEILARSAPDIVRSSFGNQTSALRDACGRILEDLVPGIARAVEGGDARPEDFGAFLERADKIFTSGVCTLDQLLNLLFKATDQWTERIRSVPEAKPGRLRPLMDRLALFMAHRWARADAASPWRKTGWDDGLYTALFSGSSSILLLIDPVEKVIADINPAAADFYGYPVQKLRGEPFSLLQPEGFAGPTIEKDGSLLVQGVFLCTHRLSSGLRREVKVDLHPLVINGRRLVRMHVHDESLRKALQHEIDRLQMEDPLTGAPNANAFEQDARRQFARARRYQRPVSIMIVDIDHFRQITDAFGFDVGDLILKFAADKLQALFRETDIFGRIRGEEFAVMMVEADRAKAAIVAERLRLSFEESTISSRDQDVRFTVSIGLTEHQGEKDDFSGMMRRARYAMTMAKERGRNQVVFFAEDAPGN